MFGRQVLGTVGTPFSLIANGQPLAKAGGGTVDWSTVAAVNADTTLYDNWLVPSGAKYLGIGQVVCLITSVVNGSKIGYYGPYDPAASDGRQTLTRGSCFLVNRPVCNNDPKGDYPELIEGGHVWKARLIQSGTATHTLALGPTLAEVLSTFPQLRLVNEAG